MITWPILILLAKVFDTFSTLLDIGCRNRGVCQEQESLLVSGLLVEDEEGTVVRTLILPQREVAHGKIELHFKIVRLKLGGFLEQRIGLRQLALVMIDD